MREILFRGFHPNENGEETITLNGKKIKGKWIEGNVFIDDKGEKAEILMGYTNYRISFDIIPETVGMFTGLTDKNGKKIFEGDIIKVGSEDSNVLVKIGIGKMNNGYYKVIGVYGEYKGIRSVVAIVEEGYDVVGNIHDNPELLE